MMKKIISILFIVSGIVLFFSSCLDEPDPFGSDANPGFSVTYREISSELIFTKNPDESISTVVNIEGKFYADPATVFDRIMLSKALVDNASNIIEQTLSNRDLPFKDSVEFSIATPEDLFEGLSTKPNDITVGSAFVFTPFGILPSGDTIEINTSVFITPDYVAFCDKPELELGTWIATNSSSSFSKEVELMWNADFELYILTDFGLDWSNWNDFWYGTQFSLACPLIETDPVEIMLAGWGRDTNTELEMLADDGATIETRKLRLMPYDYVEGSPKGYYDASTGELVFKSVSFTDNWWSLDNHTASMTFKKK